MENGALLSKAQKGGKETDDWDRTVCNVKRLPKYWKASFLAENDQSTMPFNEDILDLVDNRDNACIPHIFQHLTQTSELTALAPEMRASKGVCGMVFTRRIHELGMPIIDWCKNYVDGTTGKVNWMMAGPYQVSWKKAGNVEIAASVLYTVDKTEVPCTVLITRDFSFWDMWDVEKARAVKKPADYKFIDFFKDPTKGPKKFVFDKKGEGMKELCATVLREVQVATAMIPQGREVGQSPSATKVGSLSKDERLKKAQAAAKAAREDAKRKRVLSSIEE